MSVRDAIERILRYPVARVYKDLDLTAQDEGKGSKVSDILQPVSSMDAAGTPFPIHSRRSIPDQVPYEATLDSARRHPTVALPWWIYHPTGRILFYDDFEDALVKWTTVNGTVSRVTTDAFQGNAGLRIQSVDAAGSKGTAQRFFLNPADLPYNVSMKIAIGAFFKFGSTATATEATNLRSVQMIFRSDDGVSKFEAGLRYHLRTAGAAVQQFQVERGSDGAFIGSGPDAGNTLLLRLDNSEMWHFMGMVLDIRQTNPGGAAFMNYVRAKLDDLTISDFTFLGGTTTFPIATNTTRDCSLDLIAEDDAVAVSISSVIWDAVWIADLTGLTVW